MSGLSDIAVAFDFEYLLYPLPLLPEHVLHPVLPGAVVERRRPRVLVLVLPELRQVLPRQQLPERRVQGGQRPPLRDRLQLLRRVAGPHGADDHVQLDHLRRKSSS